MFGLSVDPFVGCEHGLPGGGTGLSRFLNGVNALQARDGEEQIFKKNGVLVIAIPNVPVPDQYAGERL